MKHSFLSMCMLAGLTMPCQMAMALNAHSLAANMQQQQKFDVKGTVVDSRGEPLIGVSIQIVGKQNGVVTDIDGHYSIKVERGQKLKFSYIGFSDQMLTVHGGDECHHGRRQPSLARGGCRGLWRAEERVVDGCGGCGRCQGFSGQGFGK